MRITPTDLLNTYFLDEDGLEDVNISEMLPRKLGWNKAFVSDEMIRGYTGELQDFVEAVAAKSFYFGSECADMECCVNTCLSTGCGRRSFREP